MPHFVSEINMATVTLTENVDVIFLNQTCGYKKIPENERFPGF